MAEIFAATEYVDTRDLYNYIEAAIFPIVSMPVKCCAFKAVVFPVFVKDWCGFFFPPVLTLHHAVRLTIQRCCGQLDLLKFTGSGGCVNHLLL